MVAFRGGRKKAADLPPLFRERLRSAEIRLRPAGAVHGVMTAAHGAPRGASHGASHGVGSDSWAVGVNDSRSASTSEAGVRGYPAAVVGSASVAAAIIAAAVIASVDTDAERGAVIIAVIVSAVIGGGAVVALIVACHAARVGGVAAGRDGIGRHSRPRDDGAPRGGGGDERAGEPAFGAVPVHAAPGARAGADIDQGLIRNDRDDGSIDAGSAPQIGVEGGDGRTRESARARASQKDAGK